MLIGGAKFLPWLSKSQAEEMLEWLKALFEDDELEFLNSRQREKEFEHLREFAEVAPGDVALKVLKSPEIRYIDAWELYCVLKDMEEPEDMAKFE